MEFKHQYVIYFLQLMIISAVVSQPPPPDIPTTEQPVNLDFSLPKTTPLSVPLGSPGNDVKKLPLCSDLICTLEFIPDHCRVTPVLERNGVKCAGCWQWKDTCKNLQNKTKDVLPPVAKCPNLTCNENIPLECVKTETYEYMGKTCEKCPVHRSGCVSDSKPRGDIQCPTQPCTLQLIPDECREIPTFQHEGITCKGCPRWRKGCEKNPSKKDFLKDSLVHRTSCPLIACDTYVPKECRVKREFQHRGRMCTKCPGWREGCREQERLNAMNFPGGNQFERQEVPCPKFPCIDNNIPAECKIEQPYEFRGRTCYRCPLRSPACASSFPGRDTPKLPPCPLMKCERRSDIPPSCYQREFYNARGHVCEKCPSIKPECLQMVPPRPNIQITPEMIGRIETPEKSCPLVRCQMMFIPPECIETPMYPHEGKMCPGCPRQREGCVPSSGLLAPPNTNGEFPQIPARKPDTKCPIKACPMIYIPPECKEDQPYQYQGKTCYDCPKQKGNCVTINSQPSQQPGNVQQMSCPMFGCPYILIPPECRVERPFQFQGKTCYMCPKWREGCVPLPPKPNINYPTSGPLTTTESNVLVPSGQNIPETSCPLVSCTKILIPSECREEQPYDYNGKTCYKCPKWKEGCLGRGNKVETSTVPTTSIDTAKLLKQNNSPSIADLKEIIPVSDIINTVNAVTCPPLRCPDMFIPVNCRQESVYQFQGRSCQGCPTWRLGCNPMSGTPMNMNANGILSFSLFNELFAFKRR